MIIGIPKEIKNNEFRVALTPAGCKRLTALGHQVLIQTGAGLGSNFSDEEYLQNGGILIDAAEELFDQAEMVVKVKEPLEIEYPMIKKDQIIFTYLHLAASQTLTEALMKSGAICMAYETVEGKNGSLPLLTPMSEIAGKMAVQQGAKYLEKPFGGRGVLLGGIPGVKRGKVMILGGGVVGYNAAIVAAGMGANVQLFDINPDRLRELSQILPANVEVLQANKNSILQEAASADLIIGAVLIPGAAAPKLLAQEDLRTLQKGTVLVDVAIDQGGCFETSKVTTHESPVYIEEGIVHYCVANIPGAVPYSSTIGLTNVSLPYIEKIAELGWEKACEQDTGLAKGLNIVQGDLVLKVLK